MNETDESRYNLLMDHPWNSLELPEVFKNVNSNAEGILTDSIQSRIKKYGRNTLPEEKPLSITHLFQKQLVECI